MTTKHYFKVDKLIRDKIPAIMRAEGIEVSTRVMGEGEYTQRLKDKLLEETHEVLDAKSLPEIQEELADVLEVITAICNLHNITIADVMKTQEQKRLRKGGFDERVYSEYVALSADHEATEYYQSKPKQYPKMDIEFKV